MGERKSPIHILVVEDNRADALLVEELFKQCQKPYLLHHVSDGAAAVDFLFQRGQYKASPRPDLVLLDLNLPRKSGREVLTEVKADNILKRVPILIVSTSDAEEDIYRCYGLHANAYLRKPSSLKDFRQLIKTIEDHWLTFVDFPNYKLANA